jgi:hypothetical protein
MCDPQCAARGPTGATCEQSARVVGSQVNAGDFVIGQDNNGLGFWGTVSTILASSDNSYWYITLKGETNSHIMFDSGQMIRCVWGDSPTPPNPTPAGNATMIEIALVATAIILAALVYERMKR